MAKDDIVSFDKVIIGDVVLPDRVLVDGYVAIDGERIAAIGSGMVPAAKSVRRYEGCLIFPGLIDAQVHAGSFEGIAGLRDLTRAASAGGITTVVDMPFDEPEPVNSVDRLKKKAAELEKIATVDVALYATAPKNQDASCIRDLADAGAASIKLSTYEYHPLRFPRFSTAEMYEIFQEAAKIDLPVAFHNEDQELVARLEAQWKAGNQHGPEAHAATRPPLAELVADAQVLELALHTGVRCHIVHSSLAAGNRIAAHYRSLGARVTVETCIHYLVFNEQDLFRQGGFLKLNPPIRSESERIALWESLKHGEIDFVSTDHVAWPAERKSDADIFKNASGVPGVETLLPAFYTGAVVERGMSPTIIARLMAENPARHFGLFPRKGRLEPGADADIAVFQRGDRTFRSSDMTSVTKWSPYEGRSMAGSVCATYVRGRLVFEDGKVVAAPGCGRFVKPSRCAG